MIDSSGSEKFDGSYEKMIQAIQSLDFEKLVGLHVKRRNKFLNDTERSSHQEVTSRLFFCVISIDVCMEVYQDFLNAIQKKAEKVTEIAQRDLVEHKESTTQALANLQNLLQEVESKEKEEFNDEYKSSVEFRQAIYERVFKDRQNTAVIKASNHVFGMYLVTVTSVSTHHSLIRLLEIADLTLLGEVLILGAQTLVGLIPFVGTFASSAWGLYDILDKKAKQYKTAGDLLTQLDNFADVALQWCIITQMLIELSNGTLSIADKNADDLEKMVGDKEIERISKMAGDNEIERISKMIGDNEIERISKIIETKLENNMKKVGS